MGDCWFLSAVAVLTETSKVLGFPTKRLGCLEAFAEKGGYAFGFYLLAIEALGY